jgi:hypothetical protein
LAGIAWLSVSIAFARRLHAEALKWIAAVAIFVLGCSPFITCWDVVVMSESVSISVLLIIITIVLHWHGKWKNLGGLAVLLLALFYFSILRATNVYILPIVALYLILTEFIAWLKGDLSNEWKKYPYRIAVRLLLISLVPAGFLFFVHETKISKRWQSPVTNSLNLGVFVKNVIIKNVQWQKIPAIDWRRMQPPFTIFPDEDISIDVDENNLTYFVDNHGMPREEAELHIGHFAWDKLEKPTPEYDAWILEKGHDAYLAFLMSHPKWVLSKYAGCGYFYSFDGRLDFEHWDGWQENFKNTGNEALMITELFYFYTFGLLARLKFSCLIMIFIALTLLIWWILLQRDEKSSNAFSGLVATLAILFSFAPLIGFIAWFGDRDYYSTWRHLLVGMVSYYIGAIMLGFVIIDLLIKHYANRKGDGVQN